MLAFLGLLSKLWTAPRGCPQAINHTTHIVSNSCQVFFQFCLDYFFLLLNRPKVYLLSLNSLAENKSRMGPL